MTTPDARAPALESGDDVGELALQAWYDRGYADGQRAALDRADLARALKVAHDSAWDGEGAEYWLSGADIVLAALAAGRPTEGQS